MSLRKLSRVKGGTRILNFRVGENKGGNPIFAKSKGEEPTPINTMVMFCSNFMIWGVVFVGGGWNSDKHIPSRMLLSALTRVKVLYLCCFDLLNGTNEKLHFPSFFSLILEKKILP